MAGDGAIEISAHAPLWLSMVLFARWRRLAIEIDGAIGRLRWGTHTFNVAPGEHVVAVGMASTARARTTVQVGAGETVRLRDTPTVIKHMPGTLEIVRVPGAHVIR
jgi:hypothetical protein